MDAKCEKSRLNDFWDEDRPHEDDPKGWPARELQQFLVDHGEDPEIVEKADRESLLDAAEAMQYELHRNIPIKFRRPTLKVAAASEAELQTVVDAVDANMTFTKDCLVGGTLAKKGWRLMESEDEGRDADIKRVVGHAFGKSGASDRSTPADPPNSLLRGISKFPAVLHVRARLTEIHPEKLQPWEGPIGANGLSHGHTGTPYIAGPLLREFNRMFSLETMMRGKPVRGPYSDLANNLYAAARSVENGCKSVVLQDISQDHAIPISVEGLVQVHGLPLIIVRWCAATKNATPAVLDSIGKACQVPVENVRCLTWELVSMSRCLNASRAKLHAKYVEQVERLWSKGAKKAALQWRVGFIAPLRMVGDNWDKALRVKCELRAAKTCRNCGAGHGHGSKLRTCPCRLVSYCGDACQKQDWKARHKKECTSVPANQKRLEGEFETADSLVVPIDSKGPGPEDGFYCLEMLGGKVVTYGRIPGNLHGDSVFVVKLSTCCAAPDSTCLHIGIYDEPRALLFNVYPSQPEFERLFALVAEKGVPGVYSPKLYAFAKRATMTSVRIYTHRMPPQVQPF